jgi:hypothetical protein
MTLCIVLLSMWAPILVGHLAFRVRGRWSTPAQVVGWLCILWTLGWMFQWIFFAERWWQLASWNN